MADALLARVERKAAAEGRAFHRDAEVFVARARANRYPPWRCLECDPDGDVRGSWGLKKCPTCGGTREGMVEDRYRLAAVLGHEAARERVPDECGDFPRLTDWLEALRDFGPGYAFFADGACAAGRAAHAVWCPDDRPLAMTTPGQAILRAEAWLEDPTNAKWVALTTVVDDGFGMRPESLPAWGNPANPTSAIEDAVRVAGDEVVREAARDRWLARVLG